MVEKAPPPPNNHPDLNEYFYFNADQYSKTLFYAFSSEFGGDTVMKHLAINSFSTCRAAPDWSFLIIFFLLVPFFPPFLNLRIFSLLRLRFSCLALIRLASREVLVDAARRAGRPIEGTTNACVCRVKNA